MENNLKYKVGYNVSWQSIDNELYVFNEKNGEMFQLDNVSKEIFIGILSHKTIEQIADEIVQKFHVEQVIVYRDILEFCQDLLKQGLIMEAI